MRTPPPHQSASPLSGEEPGKVVLPLKDGCASAGLVGLNLADTTHAQAATDGRVLFSLAARRLGDDCFPKT